MAEMKSLLLEIGTEELPPKALKKLGDAVKARALYEQADSLATAHNPPAAFARPFARRKLGR